jgi:hypothetical protein
LTSSKRFDTQWHGRQLAFVIRRQITSRVKPVDQGL